MSFEEKTIVEINVVVCVLKKIRSSKAIPKSIQIEEFFEQHQCQMNYLNVLNLPGSPAIFWINRGYEVYSLLTDDGNWFQFCLADKTLKEKRKDVTKYEETFIENIEHPMCSEKNCHAYLNFDDCEHTIAEEYLYTLHDYQ